MMFQNVVNFSQLLDDGSRCVKTSMFQIPPKSGHDILLNLAWSLVFLVSNG